MEIIAVIQIIFILAAILALLIAYRIADYFSYFERCPLERLMQEMTNLYSHACATEGFRREILMFLRRNLWKIACERTQRR